MTNAFISRREEFSGVPVQTFRNTISGTLVDAQGVCLVDSSGAPITSFGDAGPTLVAGNSISQGTIDAATLESAGLAGVILINYTSSPILQVMVFNQITSFLQISFDGGVTWMTLYPEASPTIDWYAKARKLEADVIVRKAPAITVTGESICGWGIV